jgi:hypothetical protein
VGQNSLLPFRVRRRPASSIFHKLSLGVLLPLSQSRNLQIE